MKHFFNCFSQKDAVITLQGKKIEKSSLELLGFGAEKYVYGIPGDKRCMLISRKEDAPDARLKEEKKLCDEILSLGIKAQSYEFSEIAVQSKSGGPSYKAPVLLAKKFSELAKEESFTLFQTDMNISEQRRIGKPIKFYNGDKKKLNSAAWNRGLLSKIIAEYAVGLTFRLPIPQVDSWIDDSVHFIFETPKTHTKPPIARYMFWDVMADFSGISMPSVPTLSVLKSGLNRREDPMEGIKLLINGLATVIIDNIDEMKQLGLTKDSSLKESFESAKKIESILLKAITEDMLEKALSHAREIAKQEFSKQLKKLDQCLKTEEFRTLELSDKHKIMTTFLQAAISCADMQCVKDVLSRVPMIDEFSKTHRQGALNFAKKYNTPGIYELLSSQLKEPLPPTPSPEPVNIPIPAKKRKEAKLPGKGQRLPKRQTFTSDLIGKFVVRGLIATFIGAALVLTGLAASMTALFVSMALFTSLSLTEVLRLRAARSQHKMAMDNKELEYHGGKVSLKENSMLDKYHFMLGQQAEKSWTGYLQSYLSPMTYIPHSNAANSFQAGREAQSAIASAASEKVATYQKDSCRLS